MFPQVLLLKEAVDLELLDAKTRKLLLSNPVEKETQAFVHQATNNRVSFKLQNR
jgi:hypothetical protein